MIKYNLLCSSCSENFDSWFPSSKEFEKLKKLKLITCPNCKSFDVKKSLMSPSVINKKNYSKNLDSKKYLEIKNKLKDYKNFIKNNFEYVGNNFTYEARSIHYNNKKKNKGIYGNASAKDIKELSEEGIETETIPWLSENEN